MEIDMELNNLLAVSFFASASLKERLPRGNFGEAVVSQTVLFPAPVQELTPFVVWEAVNSLASK
jgi:hypothetical protein